jgi:RNA polymerase sigma-70 factor (ECF subfamily)
MKQVEDSEILLKFSVQKTQNEAFNLLLKKYQQKIYWHIRRLVINHDDADDLVQETFVKVWKNLEKFRNDSQLYTWIYRIATNESITFLNKKKLKNNISLDEVNIDLEKLIINVQILKQIRPNDFVNNEYGLPTVLDVIKELENVST